MRQDLFKVVMVLLMSLSFMVLTLGGGCNGPSYPDPINTVMTVANHNQNHFPTTHGAAENASGDCNICHGGTTSFEDYTCLMCHAHEQEATDSAHRGLEGYSYDSKSCYGCHPSGEGSINRDDHTLLHFPIDAASAHSDPSCAECHTTGDYKAFECIECHEHAQVPMAEEHEGISGYAWDSPSCFGCHPQGESVLDREDHTDFPIEGGQKHGAVACGDCHTSSSYNDFSCIDCHTHNATVMNGAHDNVNDYQFNSPNCYSCHPDSIVLTKSEHAPFFPIVNGDHSRYGCEDCHKTQGTYQEFTCIGCHEGEHTCQKMNDEHDDVRNYECKDSACLSCHPDGREDD